MSELARQTEKEEIAYINSLCEEEPKVDTTWDINVEGKLNRNNIIFHTNKYQRLISKCKKYNDFIKKPKG